MFIQLDSAMTDDDLLVTFAMDEAIALLLETGFRKPICRLSLCDKDAVRSARLDYHCLVKVKASMDEYMEGLDELGVLEIIKKHPEAIQSLFVSDISAG